MLASDRVAEIRGVCIHPKNMGTLWAKYCLNYEMTAFTTSGLFIGWMGSSLAGSREQCHLESYRTVLIQSNTC